MNAPLPVPPRNPKLRELIRRKRTDSTPLSAASQKAGFRGWNERGFLPHRDEPGLPQFVTFRLFDSFPVELRSEWAALVSVENDRERRRQLEEYLDRGQGACWLKQPEVGNLVENALKYFHGKRYGLLAWAVMPNHAHVLFEVRNTPMSKVVESWKKFTAHETNKLLQRTGHFWDEDYWDTYMRNEAQTLKARRYIEGNPVKAKLVRKAEDWPWSSARLRNQYGALNL